MKHLTALLIMLVCYGCATGAVAIKAMNKAGCNIQEYHERTATGEIKITCYKEGNKL